MNDQQEIARAFGRRVKLLREAKKWNQERLAAEARIHRSYLAGIERGSRNPSLQNIAKIARALGVPITSLFEEDLP